MRAFDALAFSCCTGCFGRFGGFGRFVRRRDPKAFFILSKIPACLLLSSRSSILLCATAFAPARERGSSLYPWIMVMKHAESPLPADAMTVLRFVLASLQASFALGAGRCLCLAVGRWLCFRPRPRSLRLAVLETSLVDFFSPRTTKWVLYCGQDGP